MPDEFSQDAERLARFQREAEVLATLNHSNIAAVYGFEKDGGTTGIVLELVDGETLAEIIARGPLALGDAQPIARQIADAVETAHDKGVVHRDLKPANIKVTPEGKVKVLDFGLAKMLEPERAASSLSTSPKYAQLPGSWHPSGKYLAFFETNPQTRNDIMILSMEGDEASGWKPGKPTVFLNTPAEEQEPMFSPDGRWLAYHSNESGRVEVFVRPFPGPGGKWQISTEGGAYPTWSRTRHELFYRTPDNRIMVAPYTVEGDSFKGDKPRLWSERMIQTRPRLRSFDLHPDGERFAVSVANADAPADAPRDKVVFIFNFFDELRRIAPAARR